MSILFVTAYKDIRRHNWEITPRSVNTYIDSFNRLAQNINYRLVVFLDHNDSNVINRIDKNIIEKNNVSIIDLNLVNTFYNKYIHIENQIINSQEYKDKIPSDRKGAPEHIYAEYDLVNHSKINYVTYCKNIYRSYKYYSWIDFGIKDINNIPTNINFSKLTDKITYLSLKTPSNHLSSNEMLKTHDIYIAGSQFIVHHDLVDKFEKIYEEQLIEWHEQNICDDDQNCVYQIYFKYTNLFELIFDNNWFTLFSNHLNDLNHLNETIFDETIYTPLCQIMGECKSDKGNIKIESSHHNYTTFYYNIFKEIRNHKLRIFELGLGTNNINIPSNMGKDGTPGASLYAWSIFFTNSMIYGADIDKDILFNTDRIKTFYCDQTNSNVIQNMWKTSDLNENFDIIIEDGLHEFDANVCFFNNSIHKLKPNGIYIIENILTSKIERYNSMINIWKTQHSDLSFKLLQIPSKINHSDNNLLVIKKC